MHKFRRVSTRGTRWRLNYFTSFLSSKVIAKNIFIKKTSILTFLDLYGLTYWGYVNSDDRLAKEQVKSKSYHLLVFRGLLPIIVSEIIAHFRKNRYFAKSDLCDLWWPQYWHKRKPNEVVSEWFLTRIQTFFFPFLCHCWSFLQSLLASPGKAAVPN